MLYTQCNSISALFLLCGMQLSWLLTVSMRACDISYAQWAYHNKAMYIVDDETTITLYTNSHVPPTGMY